jgi:pimeloyl-ACP methyl ester carboxylesterase
VTAELRWFLRYVDTLVIAEAALLIILFRIACAGTLQPQSGLHRHIAAGLWLGMAAWIAGALLEAWVPLWQMLLIGLAAGVGVCAVQPWTKWATRPAADLFVIAALGTLSVVPIAWVRMTAAAAAFMAAGYALDRLTRRLTLRAQRILWLMPVALTVLMGLSIRQEEDFGSRLVVQDPLFPLRLALAAPLPGTRVPLPSGAAAWLLTVPDGKPVGTAVILHGNNPAAARQPAAIALQGALLRAGFDAITVEMPGYGASPNPSPAAAVDGWDPTVGPREALAQIQATRRTNSTSIIIVGHSAGVDIALQWLKRGVTAQEAYLFSGTVAGPPLSAEDTAKVFHRERRIPCCIPDQTVKQITDRFYARADRYAAELPEAHPLIQFVKTEIEYPEVLAGRQQLYAAISAPKASCTLAGMTHYMNTLSLRRFTLVDTDAVRRLARLFSASGASADPDCSEH